MLTNRARHRGRPHGTGAFTIIELIVAISVSAVLIFFVGRLFSDVGDAVVLGINKTEMAANSNTISGTIHDDARMMVGPDVSATVPFANGILIIVNHEVMAPIRSRTSDDGEVVRLVRSDQLAFIRDAGIGATALEPLVGTGRHTYAGNSGLGIVAARVWYGHVRRTHPNGSDTYLVGTTSHTVGDLGTTGSGGSQRNLWAHEWILGRQVLFLHDGATSTKADDVIYNATVSGGFATDPTLVNQLGANPPAYYALADVAAKGLTGTGDPTNAIIGTNPTDTGYLIPPFLSMADYAQRAYHLTFAIERLRVNPAMPPTSRFESWRAAQLHPHLMANVSDFIVEFAADIIDDPNIPGPDNEPDTVPGSGPTAGDIIWYSHYPSVQPPVIQPPGPPLFPVYDSNPQYRANAYSSSGALTGLPYGTGGAFVWRHDVDGPPPLPPQRYGWPYLIRIRYRLHDEHGILGEAAQTATRDADPGLWFEQIIAVNRS